MRRPRDRPRVLYFNPIPSPYFVSRFNAIAALGTVEFSAVFDRWTENDRQWTVDRGSWAFDAKVLVDGGEKTRPLRLLRQLVRVRPDVLVTLWHSPVYMFAAVTAKLLGAHVCFRVLETHEAWNRRSRIKELTKRVLFTVVADSFETSGTGADGYARRYVSGRRTGRYFHTTQSVDLPDAEHVLSATSPPVTLLYVGRMIDQKGVDVLLDAHARLRTDGVDVRLRMVGDGADLAKYRADHPGDMWLTWRGFLEGDDLRAEYSGADVFVFPTLGDPYGLVLTEAMASGCAVVTSSAAGELETRVREAGTGVVVPPGDVDALADALRVMTSDLTALTRMRWAAQGFARSQSHEHHARDFVAMVRAQVSGSRG